MKITDPGIIKNGENDLIELLKEDLDLDAVREIIQKKMTSAALSPKGGEIVVHDNQIAFRMDFELCLSGSLMFDRQGNHIPESDELLDSQDPMDQGDILAGEKTDLDLPDFNLDPLNDIDVLDELDELTDEPEIELKEEGDLLMDELADDDMTDILKESRDFWEKKKDS